MSPRPNYFFNVEIICQLRRTGMAAAGTSAIPPLATGLMQRRELSRCAKKSDIRIAADLPIRSPRRRGHGRDTQPFALHVPIELDPGVFQFRCKCRAKLLFQTPYQRVTKRNKV